ncbi:hypothetical protein TNCV_1542781 [Trichonephila clavipes]|nr:hypothetical protein TNCV_1542781 [Trichonephila clavipes]
MRLYSKYGKKCLKTSYKTSMHQCPIVSHHTLGHTSFVLCLETFRSLFVVNLPLARSKSWDAQLIVSNDPSYARMEINLWIGQPKEE